MFPLSFTCRTHNLKAIFLFPKFQTNFCCVCKFIAKTSLKFGYNLSRMINISLFRQVTNDDGFGKICQLSKH